MKTRSRWSLESAQENNVLTIRATDRRTLRVAAGLLVAWLACTPIPLAASESASSTTDLEAIFSGSIPTSSSDLRAMQAHLQPLAEKVINATVAVQVGSAQGSGVIVTEDGYVLTAAHVAGKPGRRATVILHDGSRVLGETLGVFRTMDAGLVKIGETPANGQANAWSFANMGESAELKPGQWCLATGHPGGFESTGAPVVRLGRILSVNVESAITTDCTLIGGDSGGPLFDMLGNVIGVHSRIGNPLTLNLHVPVQIYRENWEKLVARDAWGWLPGQKPHIGVQGDPDSEVARVVEVFKDSPAEKAGIRPGDVIQNFAGKDVTDFQRLKALVESEEPGTRVELQINRGNSRITVELVIGRQRE